MVTAGKKFYTRHYNLIDERIRRYGRTKKNNCFD